MKLIRFFQEIRNKVKKQDPIKYAVGLGVVVGNNCKFIGSPNWGSEPWLIAIGNHVELSFDVTFLTHDGSTWVFRNEARYKNVIRFGKIKINDNCFIGCRSTILPGVEVGENSIIAAGSVITKSVPPNSVYGGVPAKLIMTTQQFSEKCLKQNPVYDLENYKVNMKEELMRIL